MQQKIQIEYLINVS